MVRLIGRVTVAGRRLKLIWSAGCGAYDFRVLHEFALSFISSGVTNKISKHFWKEPKLALDTFFASICHYEVNVDAQCNKTISFLHWPPINLAITIQLCMPERRRPPRQKGRPLVIHLYYRLNDCIKRCFVFWVVVICDFEENRNNPVVFATAAPTMPLVNTRGKSCCCKILSFYANAFIFTEPIASYFSG